jgi:predicted metal-binding membrane protein
MMVAMMLPSLVLMLSECRRAARDVFGAARLNRPTVLVAAGYVFIWGLVGGVAYVLGASTAMAAMRWPFISRLVPIASGILIMLAALVQLTPWKARELVCCRHPAPAPAEAIDDRSALRHGVRLGLHCALCCAGLMTILLAVGVMDVGAMALVAAAITVERIAPWPEWTARLIGGAALATGAALVARVIS